MGVGKACRLGEQHEGDGGAWKCRVHRRGRIVLWGWRVGFGRVCVGGRGKVQLESFWGDLFKGNTEELGFYQQKMKNH